MSKMAELQVLNWELEVRYFPHPQKLAGLRYEIFFRYKGEPIVRDELLKRAPKIWEDRTPGAFLAHQREACSLVPTLRQVLETDHPMFWRSEEGDITLAFYPGGMRTRLPSWPWWIRLISETNLPIKAMARRWFCTSCARRCKHFMMNCKPSWWPSWKNMGRWAILLPSKRIYSGVATRRDLNVSINGKTICFETRIRTRPYTLS